MSSRLSTPIRGLLFDKDGTLFDFHLSWSNWIAGLIDTLSDGLDDRRVHIAECLEYDLENRCFFPGALSIAGTVKEQAAVLSPALPHWSTDAIEAYLVRAAADVRMVPAVPLAPLLHEFRTAGLRVGLATNDAESAARRHLEGAEIIDKFDYIAGYDSGYGAKPDPGMCTGFARTHDLDPAACVMVGDSAHDLVAGRAAGMATVAVLTGMAGPEELAPLADAVLPDIGSLPSWLSARG
ncbi:HAD family hydrolase [Roseicyclus marinus]|uniref:HAD family hydrolase n=1 Tax=Roseicyclus marinus TaxID=2161673 RepID=UPI0032AEBCA6